MIWTVKPEPHLINNQPAANMSHYLGIEIVETGDDYMIGRMPINERTQQPYGLLHGGASCVLAETLGSIASAFSVDMSKYIAVGLEINANHIRSAKSGYVYGTVRPIHMGRTTHVWDIRITNESKQLICISRLTVAIKEHPQK